jgi:hypothetical protein
VAEGQLERIARLGLVELLAGQQAVGDGAHAEVQHYFEVTGAA